MKNIRILLVAFMALAHSPYALACETEQKKHANAQELMPKQNDRTNVLRPLAADAGSNHLDRLLSIAAHNASNQSSSNGIGLHNGVSTLPIARMHGQQMSEDMLKKIFEDAPEEVHDLVASLQEEGVDSPNRPRKVLLVGPPGTGKSSLAQAIAARCNIPFLPYASSLISNHYLNAGNKNLEQIFQEARSLNGPCIIFVDEFQTLIKKHKNPQDGDATMLETLWQLLDENENTGIIFIGALNYTKKLPAQVESRFKNDKIIHIPLPDTKQRLQLVKYYMDQQQKIQWDESVTAESLARQTENFSHRDIKGLVTKAAGLAKRRERKKEPSQRTIPKATIKDCDESLKYISTGALQQLGAQEPLTTKLRKFEKTTAGSIAKYVATTVTGAVVAGMINQHMNNRTMARQEAMFNKQMAQQQTMQAQQLVHQHYMHQEQIQNQKTGQAISLVSSAASILAGIVGSML